MRILVGIEACESYVERLAACRRWMPALNTAGIDCLFIFGGGGAPGTPGRREGDSLWLPVSPLGAPHLVQRTRLLRATRWPPATTISSSATMTRRSIRGALPATIRTAGITSASSRGPGTATQRAGQGYFLSRRAMEIVSRIESQLGHEDFEAGRALAAAGMPLRLEPRICLRHWHPDWIALHPPAAPHRKMPLSIAGGKIRGLALKKQSIVSIRHGTPQAGDRLAICAACQHLAGRALPALSLPADRTGGFRATTPGRSLPDRAMVSRPQHVRHSHALLSGKHLEKFRKFQDCV